MTEDEAKTKRCPVGAGQFVTVQGPIGFVRLIFKRPLAD